MRGVRNSRYEQGFNLSDIHLTDAKRKGNKLLVCPYCNEEFHISRDTVVPAPVPVASMGCKRIATCPRCNKDSCAARDALEYDLDDPSPTPNF
ncbi:MAG TPA: hypothetical protein DEG76_00655 [Pseudohongiella sp.]|nr:hypothetical protein [Pseudohongiella sp.]HBX35886.1 hypothetical protein [Pseudohongiella sp.]